MNAKAISPKEVLRRTAKAMGGEEKLAALLEINLTELEAWLRGTRQPPFGTCIHALALLECHRQSPAQEHGGALSIGAAVRTRGLSVHS